MTGAAPITRDKLDKAIKALAYAALHYGPEAEGAFARILEIEKKFESRDDLIARAREIALAG